MSSQADAYARLADLVGRRGMSIDRIKDRLKAQEIETPSWGYADSGTRFGSFRQPGAAVSIAEKLADAGVVNRFTGVAPKVAMHVLWDLPDEQALETVPEAAAEAGVRVGSINPNVFQDQEYKFGSFCSPFADARQKAIDHSLDCIRIANEVDSKVLSMWLADGTDYPGQDSFIGRKHRLQDGMRQVYEAMPTDMTLLVEYKFFEPAFYHTDLSDWGQSLLLCQHLGPQAKVLVDLGHHAMGVNIEHIVATLLDEGMLGGFHFNNRKYADDDLTCGSVNPYEFFLIYNELAAAEEDPDLRTHVEYMIDQAHNTKLKIPAMIQTVTHIQTAYAKALLVDRQELDAARQAGDVQAAEMVLLDAYETDVRPLLAQVREELGIDPDPLRAYYASGYQERIESQRGHRQSTGGLGV
ncbi:MAG: L-rhamnose isomerase [Armatimonadetes bacterium]|nr:L-rhamnose isomerase [Armatimonadota bacterium]